MPATSLLEPTPPRRRGLVGCSRRRGTSAVEYALIAMLVSCGMGFFLVEFGPPVNRTLSYIERNLNLGPLGPMARGQSGDPKGSGDDSTRGKSPSAGTPGGGLPSGSGPLSSSTY